MDFVRPVEAIVPGAQGRVLAVMAETTAELNLRTIAELSGVSQAQASRVLPGLVELGVLDELGDLAGSLVISPVSVIVFGSFARREADADSDIDVLVVRPADVDEDDDRWAASMEQLHTDSRRLTGNPIEVLEVSAGEVAALIKSRRPLWADIRRDGSAVHGLPLDKLRGIRSAYAAKAEEFAEAAASDLESGRNIAATSLVVHEGINSADAVCGARIGQRAAGDDHDQVLVLLRQAGPDGAAVERELRRLLPLKTKAEYDPDDIAPSVAAKAVERALRCVAVARRVAKTTR
jgi:hypothetical protein